MMSTVLGTATAEDPVRRRIAHAITMASPPFDTSKCVARPLYPTSNDSNVGLAYKEALEKRSPTPADRSFQPVTLIVGHGQFETASTHLPPDDILLFVDFNPMALFANRSMLEMLRNNAELDSFSADVKAFWTKMDETVGGNLERHYKWGEVGWGHRSVLRRNPLHPQHFLASEAAYQQAHESMVARSAAFYKIDLSVRPQTKQLGHILRDYNCKIAVANFSNVFDSGWANVTSRAKVFADLPFTAKPAILESRDHKDLKLGLVEAGI